MLNNIYFYVKKYYNADNATIIVCGEIDNFVVSLPAVMAIGTKIIQLKIIPRNWKFLAITLFGLVFTADRRWIDARVKNHELIHCQQQLEWLYIPFYILYIGEWLWYLMKYRDGDRAYRSISFEREAYDNENDLDYIHTRRHYANYRKVSQIK